MDRYRDRCVGLQEAMADENVCKVEVRRYVGRCPIGGCTKTQPGSLGKGYEDNGAEARKKVWNHIRWSPAHENFGLTTDEAVDEYMDQHVDDWLHVSTQMWKEDEFDQMMAERLADGDEPDNSVPEPAGRPRPKAKGKGKGKSWRGGGNRSLEDDLRSQIQKQTANMYHFSKAATTCIAALKLASEMCHSASKTFNAQREAMEEGMEEMIDAARTCLFTGLLMESV